MGTLTPMATDMRFAFGHGRAKREDGTDYVGPIVTMRQSRPDEPTPKTVSWSGEVCDACGLRLSGTRSEE